MVLAHHGPLLDIPLRAPCLLPVKSYKIYSCHPERSAAGAKSKDLLFLLQPRILLLAVILSLPLLAPAQGCSLCRDTTAGSAPRVREGLRRAILVLGLPAGVVFLGILVVARNSKPREDADDELGQQGHRISRA
jgi:hypothetical protein